MAQISYRATYTGPLYVRPVGRGIILEGIDERPHIDEWLERALVEADLLDNEGMWTGGGRTTESVTLTLKIARSSEVSGRPDGGAEL